MSVVGSLFLIFLLLFFFIYLSYKDIVQRHKCWCVKLVVISCCRQLCSGVSYLIDDGVQAVMPAINHDKQSFLAEPAEEALPCRMHLSLYSLFRLSPQHWQHSHVHNTWLYKRIEANRRAASWAHIWIILNPIHNLERAFGANSQHILPVLPFVSVAFGIWLALTLLASDQILRATCWGVSFSTKEHNTAFSPRLTSKQANLRLASVCFERETWNVGTSSLSLKNKMQP